MHFMRAGVKSGFLEKGFAAREYFPHRVAAVPKQYPDTLLLLEDRGMSRLELLACRFCQLNLYSDHLAGFPDELFTDGVVNWHNQQLGEKGLIAAAGLCIQDCSLIVSVMQSDLCQQLFRQPSLKQECKTQVEKRFGAWYKFLFNAILDFAVESRIATIYSPTGASILRATRKCVYPELFRRIYDFPGEFYCASRVARGAAEYWEVPVQANAARAVPLTSVTGAEPAIESLICIFHDIEENVDTDICAEDCRRNLSAMLSIEKSFGVAATYDIVGALFAQKKEEICAAGGHCLAFHSYDHVLENEHQLRRCRQIDLRVRGYRPLRSRLTPALTDYSLSYYNFEWLASSTRGLSRAGRNIGTPGTTGCRLQNGMVKIPILTDDRAMATGQMNYPEWRQRLLTKAADKTLLSFGLHDCYAGCWIDCYPELLETVSKHGRFVTADELCDMTFREHI
jgi:hypothetical protein